VSEFSVSWDVSSFAESSQPQIVSGKSLMIVGGFQIAPGANPRWS
jgi:hypothetical protein